MATRGQATSSAPTFIAQKRNTTASKRKGGWESKEHHRWLRVGTGAGHLKFQYEEKKAGVPELWGSVRRGLSPELWDSVRRGLIPELWGTVRRGN